MVVNSTLVYGLGLLLFPGMSPAHVDRKKWPGEVINCPQSMLSLCAEAGSVTYYHLGRCVVLESQFSHL